MSLTGLITTAEAAADANMSTAKYLRAVVRGELPGPIVKTRPFMFSAALHEKALAGEWHPEPASNDNKKDAIMERINGRCKNEIRRANNC